MFEDGQFVSVGDAELFVSEAGNPQGIALVLLHGGLGSRHDFIQFAATLAEHYRLIAIDSRGHGRSTLGHLPLSYAQLARDITTVLGKLNLLDAGIIGHSDGAIVGLRMAASANIQPKFLVTVGAHWELPAHDPVRQR